MPDRDERATTKTGSEALARLIREARHRLGLSRHDLADATGIPYPTIAQIETAYRGVSPSRLKILASALDLDVGTLYDAVADDLPAAARPRSGSPASASREESWRQNPSFDVAGAPRMALMAAAPPPGRSVVDSVVDLLSAVPADRRLDVLAQVQSRVLAGLVEDEVRRKTGRRS